MNQTIKSSQILTVIQKTLKFNKIVTLLSLLFLLTANTWAARTFSSMTVSAQSGTATYGTGTSSITYTVTLNTTGSGNYGPSTLSVSGLPAGATGSFNPADVTGSNAIPSPTSTLTITTIGTTPVGNEIFTVTESIGSNTQTGTLTVGQAPLTVTANDVYKVFGNTLTGGSGSTAFSPNGLKNGETIGSVTVAYGAGAGASDTIGTYIGSVTPSAATGGTFTTSNYSLSYANGNIIVTDSMYTITATAGVNGNISPSGSVSVSATTNQSFSISPDEGYTVDSLIVDGLDVDSTTSYTFYNVVSDHTIHAVFSVNYFTLTVNAINGSVSRNPDTAAYLGGTNVILTATANTGYTFANWSGDLSGTENPDTITMNGDKTVTANFSLNYYTLTVNATNGSVAQNPDTAAYAHGTNVVLTATGNTGYHFDNWSGDLSGTENPDTIAMTANKTVTANFSINYYTLTVNATNGSVAKSPDTTAYAHGTNVILNATANTGYSFASWSDDLSGTENPDTIAMTANKTVTANFSINYYTLTVNATNGSVAKSPDTTAYAHGTNVVLTATANTGYHFDNWSGDISGTENPDTLTMDGNKAVTANFSINYYTLTVNATNGSVAQNPDTAAYAHGTNVVLTATGNTGYHFDNWSGDLSGTENPDTIAMTANKTVTANFSINYYTLTVNATNGSVAQSPDTTAYSHGTNVILTATANTGYHFDNWSGDLTGTENPDTLTMDGDKTVTANFSINYYTLTVNATNGSVAQSPDTTAYAHGTNVFLTATGNTGYHFDNWSGDLSGTENPDTVTMDGNKTVTANFSLNYYTLTVNATNGSVAQNPDTAVYAHGTNVVLTATGNTGYHFDNWSGDLSGTENPDTIAMTANKTVTANFSINYYTLTVNATNGSVAQSPDTTAYSHGTNVILTATGSTGYHFDNWSGDLSGTENPDTLTMDGNKTVTANFVINTYEITASAGADGSISPSGTITLNYNESQTFTITANSGFYVSDVLVDDVSQGSITSYTFSNVSANHTISATFSGLTVKTWIGSGNGGTSTDFNNGANWNPSGVPTVADNVTFSAGTPGNPTTVALSGSITIGALTISENINANNSRWVISIGANTLTVNADVSVNNGGTGNRRHGISISTGSLVVNGNLTVGTGTGVGGDLTFTGAGTVNAKGNITYGTNATQTAGTGTINLSAGAQTLTQNVAITFNNLTLSGSGVKTHAGAGVTTISATGTLTLNGTSSYSGTTPTYTAGSTLRYAGTSAQTTGTEFPATMGGNVTIANSNGVTLDGSKTTNATLTLSSGNVSTGANTLTIGATGTVSRTSGHIVGNLTKNVALGATTRTFEIGDASNYTPVDIAFGNVSTAGTLNATTTSGDHVDISNSTLIASKSVNRFWTVTNAGTIFDSYNATLNYVTGDIDETADANKFVVKKLDGTTWSSTTTGTRSGTSTQATGLTSFSDFVVGEVTPYTIIATAGENGTITPSDTIEVVPGDDQTFSVVADTGYHIDSVSVDGVSVGSPTSYTFNDVAQNHTIHATFAINVYTITSSAGANGSITPSGTTNVNHGGSQAYTITPDSGYVIDSLLVDGSLVESTTSYTFSNITANHTISVSFIQYHTIVAGAGENGSINPAGNVVVKTGHDQTFIITPDSAYTVGSVFVDGNFVDSSSSYTFYNVTSDSHNIFATFTQLFTITASAGSNGSISPSGAVTVPVGDSQTYTITPDFQYVVDTLLVDGNPVDSTTSYTFNNVSADHSISATFRLSFYVINASSNTGGSVTPSGEVHATPGEDQMFAIAPSTGYHLDSVFVDSVFVDSTTSYTFPAVSANHTIHAQFAINTYTITASSDTNGTISPSGATTVNYGDTLTYSFTPNSGYHVDEILVDDESQTVAESYTFENITADHSISVTFAINVYTLVATSGTNGSVTPDTAMVIHGDTLTFTITADSGYNVDSIFVDNVATAGAGETSYTFTSVSSDHTLHVTFVREFSISASAGSNGSISSTGVTKVLMGRSQAYTITPNTGYHIDSIFVDDGFVGSTSPYTFDNVSADHTIHATFTINVYTITSSADSNSSITPMGTTSVNYGSNQTYTMSVAAGYSINDVLVDGNSVGPVSSYTFTNISADHTISVSARASAGGITSTTTGGNWGSSATWVGGVVPGAGDTVTIAAGATVTVNGSFESKTLTLNNSATAGSTVNITAGNALNVGNGSGAVAIGLNLATITTTTTTSLTVSGSFSSGTVSMIARRVGNRNTDVSLATNSANASITIDGNIMQDRNVTTGGLTNDVSLAAGGSLNLSGNFVQVTSGGTFTIGTTTTIDYSGSGAQTIPAGTYFNLTLGGSGTKTTTGVTVNGTLSMQGTATATTAPTYGAGAVLEYKSTSAQTTSAEFLATLANVVIDNASGVTLDASKTVTGTLTLTSGYISTGANTLTASGTVSRTNGHIVGNFAKPVTTGSPSVTFEVGDANTYSPAQVSFGTVSTAGTLTAKATGGDHPNLSTSNINSFRSLNRYWTIANTGVVFDAANLVYNFTSSDVDANSVANDFIIAKYDSPNWTYPTKGTQSATSIEATGITSFSDFAFGQLLATYTIVATAGENGSVSPADTSVVNEGSSPTFTFTPSTGYHVDSIFVDGTAQAGADSYTFNNVSANHTLHGTFAINSYTLTVNAENGTVAVNPDQSTYTHGTSVELTATSDTGYHFVNWSGGLTGSENPDTVVMDGNKTVTANFAIDTFTISASADGNGTISPSGDVTVNYGSAQQFTFSGNTGYHADSVFVDDVFVDSTAGYTFSNVTANHTIHVTFALNMYSLTANAENGTVTKNPSAASYAHGSSVELTATSDSAYVFTNWSGDLTGSQNPDTLLMDGDKTVTANFVLNTRTITATAGANGSISPSGAVTVDYAGSQRFTFAANEGFALDTLYVDGSVVDSISGYTFTNVTDDHTIHVVFTNLYTISASAGSNGSINPSGSVMVLNGRSQTFTFAANTGYHLDSLVVDGVGSTSESGSYTFSNVTENHSINVTFAINTYTLSASAGENGTITPSGDMTVNYGSNQRYVFSANTGYHVDSLFVDDSFVDSTAGYTFSNITSSHTIHVTFALNGYTLTVNATNGTVAKNPDQSTYTHGTNVELTASPSTGYHFTDWSGDVTGSQNPDTLLMDGNKTVTANFTINVYTINASAGSNATISPSGDVSINYGNNQTFTMSAAEGYTIDDVLVDGNSVGPVATYTFSAVDSNHTISVSARVSTGVTSTATGGNWSSGATWVGGSVPGSGDSVMIAPGATVTVDGNFAAKTLTVGNSAGVGSSLVINSGNSLNVGNGSGSVNVGVEQSTVTTTNTTSLTVGGTLTSGTITMTARRLNNKNTDISFSTNSANAIITVQGDIVQDRNATVGNASNDITFASGGTLNLTGDFVQVGTGGTFTNGTTTTFNYNGTGTQTVLAGTYFNLTLGGSGDKTTTGVTVNGTLSMQGTATASAVPTYGGSAVLEYKGSASQTTGVEFPASFGNVVINNSNGVTLGASKSITGTLTLTSGNVSTGSNTLALTSTGTISRTPGSGHVVGNLQKNVATGASIRTFEIGDDDEYTPVTVSFGNVTVAGNLTAKSTGTEHPNLSSSTLNVLRSLNRYWTITNAGITFNSAGIVFNYVSADVDANTNANNFSVGKYDSPNWTYPTKGTQTATSIQATGITSFSDFTFAEQLVNYTIIASAGSNGTISPSDTLVLAEGADQTFTITANATYHLDSLFVDGTSVPTTSEYTFTNITSNHTIHATFAINMYSLTVNAENGTVSTNPEQASYAHGTSVELTASSATGYHFANWSDDLTGSENPDTLIMNGDKTVTANFEINTYTLTVNAENGTVSKNPEQDTYNHGSSVELTATSATGYYFANWSGDLSGSENPDTLVMNGDKTVTANFEINTYTLTVNATNGTVSKNPNQESYTHGSSVELTASPATGYHFANWSDDLSGSENPDTLLMDGDKTVTVNFEINTFTITATADENGSIAPSGDVTVNYSDNQQFTFSGNTGYHVDSIFVDDAFVDSSESYTFVNVTENHTIHATFAINMYSLTVNAENGTVTTSPMMESYAHGTMVELTAAASEGYHFAYWSNDLGGSENPDTLEMTSDKTVTANFEINSYTITASADDNGSIFPSGEVSVNYGDDMQFTFAADEGYHFDSLFVDDAFVDSSESFTFMNVSSDHSIYATFAINMYSLTVNAENGTVAKNPNQESYAHGSEVELTATAATGYAFVNWSGDASGSDNPLMITMAGNTTITANFSSNTFTLTVSAENGSVAINPDQTNYVSGTEVTLTASANTGYHFTNWSGDASGSTNPLTIVMDGDKEIFAHFSINTYSLTINAENGSVSANPSENEYEHGSMVELTATAENGYHFVDWSGDLTGTENPDTLLMNEDKTVTANFAINMYSLTITAENGTVTKNPSQELYAHGTSVELTATPSEGYAFTFWSGDASGSDNPTSVTMDDDKSVTANFAMNTFTLTVTSENGNVTVDPDQASYEQGTSVQLTATPFTGYHFVNWSGDLSGNENPDTLVIDSDKSVTANFALDSFTITASAGDNGSITPSGEITVMYGDDTTFTISANENYAIADVLVDGNSVGAVSSYTFENVSENHTIAASFAFGTYTITATAGENGTIEPSGEVEVTYGNDQTFAITPSEGYQVDDVLVDNNSVGAVGSYTFENVNADHSIAASFAIAEFIIMASAGENGTISPSGEVSVNYGSDIEFTITADTGYHISSVMVDNESVGDVSSYTFFNVTADHSIHASFSIDMFTIFANAGENGIIEPAGEVMVNYGADQSFAISANEGYHIYNVLVDNDSVGPLTQYTFTNVMENHSISASFEINEYTITASAGDNGSIVPPGAIVVDYGTDIAFKMLPNEGYHVDSIVVDNEYAGDSSTYMFMHVSSNHTIHATFAINVYYILATAGQNGTITPSGQVQVNYGATQAFTITPDVNYQHDSVIVDGVRIDSTKSYTFRNIATNHNIRATFKLMTYTILATSGQNGTISPSGQVQVIHGANQTFRMTPNVGYVVDSVVVDGGFVGRDTTYTFTEVTANHSISVKFRIMTYTILATPGQNGAIAPSGQVQVNHGANQTFRMIPNNGFIVDSIIVDGSFVGRDTTFTFQNVTANHTIRVAFRLTPPGQVILVSPAHGAVIPADSVRLVWRMARPNVTKYYILGALDSLFTNARLDSTTDTSFIVRGLPDNVTFWWKVRARNGSGIGQFSEARKFRVDIPGGVNDGQGLPTEFAMAQNYPNPFNPTTNIKFGLPKEATVTLTIFNALGQEVATLVNEVKQSGWHEVTWNSNEVSTGMYIYRITAVATSNSKEVFTSTRKMILAK